MTILLTIWPPANVYAPESNEPLREELETLRVDYIFAPSKELDRSKVKMQKFSEDFNLQILYWDDLVVDCCLPFKSYSSFFKKAKTLNIEIEDFLAQQIYKK